MNVHKYKRDVNEMLAECNGIIENIPGSDYLIRLLAVRNVLMGSRAADVAQTFNVSQTVVNLWVRTYDDGGPEALITKPRSGRPKKLTKEQLRLLDEALQKPAKEADENYRVWDSVTLSNYIKSKFGIEMSDRNCLRIFRELNFSRQRPQPFPSKGHEDDALREAFKKTSRAS